MSLRSLHLSSILRPKASVALGIDNADSGVGNQLLDAPSKIVLASSEQRFASKSRRWGWCPGQENGSSESKASAIRRSLPQEWHLSTISDASPDAPYSRRLRIAGWQATRPLYTNVTQGKSVMCPARHASKNRTERADGQ